MQYNKVTEQLRKELPDNVSNQPRKKKKKNCNAPLSVKTQLCLKGKNVVLTLVLWMSFLQGSSAVIVLEIMGYNVGAE